MMMQMIRQFLRRKEGQGMAEYALILALVAVVAIIALNALGPQVSGLFSRIAEEIGHH
jgi:pilus assembly protein Flp/PilA